VKKTARWIAEIPALPGVLAYGDNNAAARPVFKRLQLVSSRIGSKMAKRDRAKIAGVSRPRERLAFRANATGADSLDG